jgi:CRP-like cAMP-binding protein
VSIGKWWAKHHKSIELCNLYVEGPDGAGIPASEVDVWYGPFHYPLQQAIETYEAMLEEQTATREPGFRIAVLAKRLLDLDPKNSKARETLEAISARSFARRRELEHLYDKFLSPLSPSALNYFFSNATFKAFQKDEIVVKEGDPANSMMMVVSGEIGLSIKMKGKPLHELAEHGQPEDRGLTFQEGAIIGEMGLFSPGGRRTATVKALRNTIMLTLDYGFLKLDAPIDPSITVPPRVMNIAQIRSRIWEYYCQRMIQNQISSYPLFQRLSGSEANQLAETGQFLPTDYGKPVELNLDHLWRFWIVVVSGGLTVSMSKGDKTTHVKYGPGECLGPIRLSVAEDPFAPNAPNPFSEVAVEANTQVILFRWSRIKDLIENEELRDFRQDCILSGGVDRLRYRFADSR